MAQKKTRWKKRGAQATSGSRENKTNRQPADITEYRKKRRKKTHTPHGGTVLLAVLFVMFVIYLAGYFITFVQKPKIATSVVEYGSIETPHLLQGIIIRDEKVYASVAQGTVDFLVDDQERVKPGTQVCSIRDEKDVASLENNLDQVKQGMLALQEKRLELSAFQKDVENLQNKMKKYVDNNAYQYINMNMPALYTMKEEIEKDMGLRNQILFSDSSGSLQEMANTRQYYEDELARRVATVTTEESGLISYVVDGFESLVTLENMYALTKEQTRRKPEVTHTGYARSIDAGEGVFKNIVSNTWYIAAYVDTNLLDEIFENDVITIYLAKNGEYMPQEAVVEKLDKGEKESFLLFKCTKNMMNYLDVRGIDFKLADEVQKGLKVPNSSIVDRTFLKIPEDYVYDDKVILWLDGKGQLTPITNKGTGSGDDTGYIYVPIDYTNLRIDDVIVKTGEEMEQYTISETSSAKGVYLVNRGIAEFVRINDQVEPVNPSGYTILNPQTTLGLQVKDRIVTEAANVYENQIIN